MSDHTVTVEGYTRSTRIAQALLEFGKHKPTKALSYLLEVMRADMRIGKIPPDRELVAPGLVGSGLTIIQFALSADDPLEPYQSAATAIGAGILRSARQARRTLEEGGADMDSFAERCRDLSAQIDVLQLGTKDEVGQNQAPVIEGGAT
jgi:hypothetical protein